MSNPNVEENTRRHKWAKGQSGNPAGYSKKARERDRVKADLAVIFGSKKKVQAFAALDVGEINAWEQAVLTMNVEDLKALAKQEDAKAYPKGLAVAILFDMKNGKTNTIDKLRERQFGKAANKIELTGKDGTPLYQPRTLTPDEMRELFTTIQNEV